VSRQGEGLGERVRPEIGRQLKQTTGHGQHADHRHLVSASTVKEVPDVRLLPARHLLDGPDAGGAWPDDASAETAAGRATWAGGASNGGGSGLSRTFGSS